MIRTLQEDVTRPENTVRWHWRVGDLAIWDNRSTQHCAVVDYGNAHRRCERVTVAGATPVGVDGRPGVSLKGDALDLLRRARPERRARGRPATRSFSIPPSLRRRICRYDGHGHSRGDARDPRARRHAVADVRSWRTRTAADPPRRSRSSPRRPGFGRDDARPSLLPAATARRRRATELLLPAGPTTPSRRPSSPRSRPRVTEQARSQRAERRPTALRDPRPVAFAVGRLRSVVVGHRRRAPARWRSGCVPCRRAVSAG